MFLIKIDLSPTSRSTIRPYVSKNRGGGRAIAKLHTNFHFDPIGALEMDKLLVGRHFVAPVQIRESM